MAAFEELGLEPAIVRAVEELGWLLPTPVQVEAIPLILGGGDVMAAAETGSGKTGAFALPVLQISHEALREQAMAKSQPKIQAASAARTADAASLGIGIGQDRDGILQVALGGLECSCMAEKTWAGARAGRGVAGSGGLYYFEVTQLSGGLCRVGWSALSAKLALGTDKYGFGFGGTGKKSNGGQFNDYGEPYGKGDVIGCALDRRAGTATITFYKNGASLGEAFSLPSNLSGTALFPAICVKGATVRFNFGTTSFVGLPAGATPLGMVAHEHSATNSSDGTAAAVSSFGRGGGAAAAASGGGRSPIALILEPARDLCEQVHECIVSFAQHFTDPCLEAALLVGGVDPSGQLKRLRAGVDVVSGTPGRVLDLVQSNKLALSEVQFFILDEADRLLDTGNLDVILKLYAKLPRIGRTGGRLQTLLFSATLHTAEVRSLAERITSHPTLVDLKGKEHVPETVHHVVVHIDPGTDTSWASTPLAVPTDGVHRNDKIATGCHSNDSLSEGIKKLKPLTLLNVVERLQMTQCMIFCRTNLDCDHLEAFLNAKGGGKAYRGKAEKGIENPYSCVVLAGQRSMEERRRNLAAFKEGDIRFLICTDVAARGLDIKELPYVINMTLPDKEEDYVHRVGRVGRADVMGLAISIVASKHKEKVWYYDKRKWEGKTLSTKLASEGGCCIWYDEPGLLRGVQKRLGTDIESLDAFLTRLPGGLSALSSYGQAKDGGLNEATTGHLQELKPRVSELARLETAAQHSFLLGLRLGMKRPPPGNDSSHHAVQTSGPMDICELFSQEGSTGPIAEERDRHSNRHQKHISHDHRKGGGRHPIGRGRGAARGGAPRGR